MPNIIKYPRGFNGLDLGHKPKLKHKYDQYELTAIGGIGFPNPIVTKQEPFNDDIDACYFEMLNNKPGVLKMEFREKVFKLVLATFGNGTVSVKNFAIMQRNNGKVSQFIEDTFKYILTGKREIAIQTWDDMLNETNLVLIDNKKATYLNQACERFTNPFDLIQAWCSNQNGFYDMLYTMHILYGDEK